MLPRCASVGLQRLIDWERRVPRPLRLLAACMAGVSLQVPEEVVGLGALES